MNPTITRAYRRLGKTILMVLLMIFCAFQPANKEVVAAQGMVASAHVLASQVGVGILQQGGNAYDAAVAVHFTLAVVFPFAGNLGGGGFAVIHTANGEENTLDFREKAPILGHKNMYLNSEGNVIKDLSLLGHLAVGVPGSVDGMVRLHNTYGVLPWKNLLQPAIDLAQNGFAISASEAQRLNEQANVFKSLNTLPMPLFKNELWKNGDTLIQTDLAHTLTLIAQQGRAGFYEGKTAMLLLQEMKRGHGIVQQQDLSGYESIWRKPVKGNYKGYEIVSMGPPSSGGVALIQLLAGAQDFNLHKTKHNSARAVHIITELERRVYADRATYLGDPDFVEVPVEKLTSKAYNASRNKTISLKHKTQSTDIKEGKVDVIESMETTHFSIVDKDRNAISVTTTLNGAYGCKVMVAGAGFLLNNEMDDFSLKSGIPNQFGLVGAQANEIAAEKRMLSSMTPTIVTKNGKVFLVVGTPGGSTIITSVFQTILNVIDYNMGIQEAVDAEKCHHQWLPDQIFHEPKAITEKDKAKLLKMGHNLVEVGSLGRMNCILIDHNNLLHAGADSRGDDEARAY